jgi:8-oxo-dGTP diphosphatase
VKDNAILLVEYEDHGIHYNLPGGGAEPGETVIQGLRRELYEETMAEADIGSLAMLYEYAPHAQSGDYVSKVHSIHLIFECTLKDGSTPRLPDNPDPHQSAVKWIPINELDSIVLIPNIKSQIKDYIESKSITYIEDYQLQSFINR